MLLQLAVAGYRPSPGTSLSTSLLLVFLQIAHRFHDSISHAFELLVRETSEGQVGVPAKEFVVVGIVALGGTHYFEQTRWRETIRGKDKSVDDVRLIIPEDQENVESAAVPLLGNQPG